MKQGTKTALRILLNVINSAGIIGTGYLAAKEAPSANENLEKLKAEKGESVTKIDILKCTVKSYAPAIAVGGLSIASNVCSAIISKKTEASLVAGMVILEQSYTKYKNKVTELYGKAKNNEILKDIAKDDVKKNVTVTVKQKPYKKLYWEEHIGVFECEPEKFGMALHDLQMKLADPGYVYNGYNTGCVSVKEWVDMMEADVKDKSLLPGLEYIGWSEDYLSECFETCLVHPWIDSSEESLEKFGYIRVWIDEEPIVNFNNFDYDEWERRYCIGRRYDEENENETK